MKKQDNFLDYIPKHNDLFPFEKNQNGHVEIRMENRGLIKRLTQLLLKKPRYTYIELDDFGTFVWEQIDGENTVYEIGKRVKEQFGEAAEPLYERLCQYIRALRTNRFILYKNLVREKKQ